MTLDTPPETSDRRWLQRPQGRGGTAMSRSPAEAMPPNPAMPEASIDPLPTIGFDHGLPERTVREIRECLQARFPQIHWLKLYGSRAMGRHWHGSDIDLAFSADEDCSAALLAALDDLPTPYLFDVTHWESTHHPGLRDPIERVGRVFP